MNDVPSWTAPTAAAENALRAEVERVRDALVRIRRQVHARPELAFAEVETAALVARHCAELGLRVRRQVGGTGVLAEADSGRPGPTLLVRADMDALPVQEGDDGRPCRSETAGVMHACGHDGHVAIALGVAEILVRLTPLWSGRVRMCFQPAEETDEGAQRMIADGALDGVDLAVGLHLQAGIPTGTIGIGPGVQWAGSDELRMTVHGVGGHAGDPASTVDPILVAAEIILAFRQISGTGAGWPAAVLTVAQLHAGTAPNVVPETATLGGTLRTFGESDRQRIIAEIDRVSARIAHRHGASVTVSYGPDCPAVVCDPQVTELVRAALSAASSPVEMVTTRPSTTADDMARFLQAVPGCYFRVGASDPSRSAVYPHHHPRFDLDEAALPVGAEALARAALVMLATR